MEIGLVLGDRGTRDACSSALTGSGVDCAAFASAREALAAARRSGLPRVVFVDLDPPSERGVDSIPAMQRESAESRFVAMSTEPSDETIFEALGAGCEGFVLKREALGRLAALAREVERGGVPLSPAVTRRILASFRAPPSDRPVSLSRRELTALQALADGWSYEQCALHLGISLGAVRAYVQRGYRKLGVHTKSEATARLLRLRLLR